MGTIYSMEGNMLNKEFLEFNNSIKLENESTVLREKRDLLKKDFQSKFPKNVNQMILKLNHPISILYPKEVLN